MSDHTNRDLYTNPKYIHRYVGGNQNVQPINNQNYVQNQLDLIRESNNKLPPRIRPYHNNVDRIRPYINEVNPRNTDKYNEIDERNRYYESIQANLGNNNQSSISRSINDNYTNNTNNVNNTDSTISNTVNQNFKGGYQTQKGLYFRPESTRYDSYEGFLHKKGLLDDGTNRRRFKTTYINIDSKFRIREPSSQVEDAFLLLQDPLTFRKGSNTIFVNHPNSNYEEGDLITLTGATARQTILRTFDDNGEPSLQIPAGCNFMRITMMHGIPLDYTGTEIQVEFNGIRGDRGTVETSSFLGNIPTNILNSRYSIKLSLSEDDLSDGCDLSDYPADYLDEGPDHFFVILPRAMHNPANEPAYVLREYNYKVLCLSLAGIPLNLINAEYPITPDRRNGFHVIRNVGSQGYNIETINTAVQDADLGGSCIYIARITSVNTGYPNPNSYSIDLGRTFHDIVSARLISIEFPNSQQVFRIGDEFGNNMLCWNDIDDGDFLYCIEVPTGNYTPARLAAVLEGLFFNTPRVNAGADIGATYTQNHFVQVSIDTETDIVTFKSFKEFVLVEPITDVTPTPSATTPAGTQFILTITHPGHGLTSAGETVMITDAIAHLGIPASSLNSEHEVFEIIDENSYRIRLPRLNLESTKEDTKGGASVTILVPDLFRLRIDQENTLGGLLGFRNPEDPNSVTSFSTVITNNDPYAFDVNTNAFGEPLDLTNNAVQISGDNYVLMIADPLVTLYSIGPIKEAFAKINLCDLPGKILFNSHVSTSKLYEDPIHELSTLNIAFYSPDGSLYDFNGLDHSFTIEIVTVQDIPSGTGISANTGRNYNIQV